MTYSIGFDIFAKDRAGPVISKVGDEFHKAESKMGKFKASAIAGGAVAGAAIVGFALKSVNAFKEVGGQTLSLQRTMGGTAETASRLRFAATESGVSFESFSKSTNKLAKFLAASAPVLKTVTVRMKENQNSTTLLSEAIAKNSHGIEVHTQKIRTVANGMQTLTTRVREGAGPWKTTGEVVTRASDKFINVRKQISVTNPVIAKLGINVRDSHGHLKSMADILPMLADKFAKMPNGPEKTALAMQLFGKAGTEMLPFLNKGASGVAELEKQSDKYGLTLSGKMLQSIKDSKANQREWNATLEGLQVQIGAQVLPIMTKFAGLIRDRVIPVILKVTGFLQKHAGTAKFVAMIIGTLVLGIKAWTIAQAVLNTVMALSPIGMIVIGLAALAVGFVYAYKHCQTFRDIVKGAFKVVAGAVDFVRDHWKLLIDLIMGPFGGAIVAIVTHFDAIKQVAFTSVSFIVRIFLDMVGSLVHGAAEAFGWVPGMGGKLKNAARAFDKFKDDVNNSLSQTKNSLTINANTLPAYKAIQAVLQYAGTASAYVQVSARAANGASSHGRQGFAAGTSYAPPGRHWVGEHGPELADFRGGERITPHSQSMREASRSGQDEANLTVNLNLDGNTVHQLLLKVKRGKGGLSLGLA